MIFFRVYVWFYGILLAVATLGWLLGAPKVEPHLTTWFLISLGFYFVLERLDDANR